MFAGDFFRFLRSTDAGCRIRLAPTPSGFLHAGNALNFILNWLVARYHGGSVLLRIDDLDAARKRPEYLLDIRDSLFWLGLDWDEGPGLHGVDFLTDFERNWSQYRRMPLYINLLDRLRSQGKLFACAKSRSDLAATGAEYPQAFTEQGLSLDQADVAWRIYSPELTGSLKHFIARRRDGIPAYQIASVADDLYFHITHVIRGEDLLESTRAQQYMARQLGEDKFLSINFLHHPLLLDHSGRKLSKSAGDTSLRSIRDTGAGPAEVYRQIARLLELPICGSAPELLERIQEKLSADFSDI